MDLQLRFRQVFHVGDSRIGAPDGAVLPAPVRLGVYVLASVVNCSRIGIFAGTFYLCFPLQTRAFTFSSYLTSLSKSRMPKLTEYNLLAWCLLHSEPLLHSQFVFTFARRSSPRRNFSPLRSVTCLYRRSSRFRCGHERFAHAFNTRFYTNQFSLSLLKSHFCKLAYFSHLLEYVCSP